MLKDMDFGIYGKGIDGKGIDGYVHYSLAMDNIGKRRRNARH